MISCEIWWEIVHLLPWPLLEELASWYPFPSQLWYWLYQEQYQEDSHQAFWLLFQRRHLDLYQLSLGSDDELKLTRKPLPFSPKKIIFHGLSSMLLDNNHNIWRQGAHSFGQVDLIGQLKRDRFLQLEGVQAKLVGATEATYFFVDQEETLWMGGYCVYVMLGMARRIILRRRFRMASFAHLAQGVFFIEVNGAVWKLNNFTVQLQPFTARTLIASRLPDLFYSIDHQDQLWQHGAEMNMIQEGVKQMVELEQGLCWVDKEGQLTGPVPCFTGRVRQLTVPHYYGGAVRLAVLDQDHTLHLLTEEQWVKLPGYLIFDMAFDRLSWRSQELICLGCPERV